MLDLSKYRDRHYKVVFNTDPSGIHYSTYGVDYDGCFTCEEAWPCEVSQLCDEVDTELKELIHE